MAGKKINLTDQLKKYFGFDTFKGNQEAIIQNLLAGNDNNDLPYSVDRLNDYLNVLIKYRDKKQTKKVTDMSADELRQFADRIKNKKS